jgi:multicomponent Na+:H+ antiporter subunit D
MSDVAIVAPLAITVPILGACLLLPLGSLLPRAIIDATALLAAAATVVFDALLFSDTGGGRVVTWLGHWTPVHGHSVGIVLIVDRIGAGTALLAAVLTAVGLMFGWRHMQGAEGHFHTLMLLFLAGMTGFCLTGDLFDMFVFFELMGAAAFALTGFKVGDPTSVQGGLNFGIVNSLGAYLTLTGIGVLYSRTGQLGLAQLGQALQAGHLDALVVIGFVLVSTGWLVKAAVAPFHFWLADAHAVAPTPVCVLFSGVMVELGVYGVYRVYWTTFAGVLPEDKLRPAFLVLGTLTALVGAVMCLAERHFKRLLAYSTIAHVGLFVTAAATLDAPGFTGAATYVLGHAAAKASLFMIAGLLLNRYRTVDEITLHGRGRELKLVAVLFGIAGLALAGAPGFGSGLGKAIGEDALSKGGYWFAPPLFVLVSALTAGAVFRAGARIFLGLGPLPRRNESSETTGDEEQPETDQRPRRKPVTMIAPIVVLLACCLLTGLVPSVVRSIGQGAAQFLDHAAYISQSLHDGGPTSAGVPPDISWTGTGVALGVLSTVLAFVVAVVGIYASAYRRRIEPALRPLAAPFSLLRQLHSGHVGDYIAWLFIGMSALAALVGIPLAG